MKKTVLFVLISNYADWEAAYLSSMLLDLAEDEFSVKTVSITKDPVRSIGGFTVLPDYDIDTVPDNFEGLILIGGTSWRTEEAKLVAPLVKKAISQNKVLGAICDATVFLGAQGVFNNVKHTSNELKSLKDWAKEAYTGEDNYIMEQAVRDKNIITANGSASLEFAKEVLLALNAAPEEYIMEDYNFYKLGYYQFMAQNK